MRERKTRHNEEMKKEVAAIFPSLKGKKPKNSLSFSLSLAAPRCTKGGS